MPTMRRLLLLLPLIFAAYPDAASLNEELLAAARKGNVEVVSSLLDKGADMNAKSPYGVTPLYFAAGNGHVEVVKLLLQRGAELNAKDTFYRGTALSWAASKGQTAVVKMLLDKGAEGRDGVLITGVSQNNVELVKLGLEKGDLNQEILSEALGRATRNNRAEIAELLRKAGAVPPPKGDFSLDPEMLKTYAGVYRNEQGLEFTITVKDGKLFATLPGQAPIALGAIDKTTFRPLNFEGVTIAFQVEGAKVISFTRRQRGNSQVFKRVEAP